MHTTLTFFLGTLALAVAQTASNTPPYVLPCPDAGQAGKECYVKSIKHLAAYMAHGLNDIGVAPMEPLKLEAITLQLGNGPDGYKNTLLHPLAYGLTNFSITHFKVGNPAELVIKTPHLKMTSDYVSSGVLLLIRASGGGDFAVDLYDVTTKAIIKHHEVQRNGRTYVVVDDIALDVDPKKSRMAVDNLKHGNRILKEALNLFLEQNSDEVLGLMKSQLNKNLSKNFKSLMNGVLQKLPMDMFVYKA